MAYFATTYYSTAGGSQFLMFGLEVNSSASINATWAYVSTFTNSSRPLGIAFGANESY
jgi:hypothetical protein